MGLAWLRRGPQSTEGSGEGQVVFEACIPLAELAVASVLVVFFPLFFRSDTATSTSLMVKASSPRTSAPVARAARGRPEERRRPRWSILFMAP